MTSRQEAREAWHDRELLATATYTWPVQEWQAPQERPQDRPVPWKSGEAAIYSPEYLRRKEGNARGTAPSEWRLNTP